jgi:hypothetical protein
LNIAKGMSFALLSGRDSYLLRNGSRGGKKHGLIIDRSSNSAFALVAVTIDSAEKPSVTMAQRLDAGLGSARAHEHPRTRLAHDAVH